MAGTIEKCANCGRMVGTTEKLEYKPVGADERLRRQVDFWRWWSVIATGLLIFVASVMASTGPELYWLAFRNFLHELFGGR